MITKFKEILSMILYYSGILYLNSILSQKRLTIITFHRIVSTSVKYKSPNRSMMTTKCQFEKLIKMIAKYTNPISLETAIFLTQQGMLPRRSTVITFDDGYADNYTNAYPILKKYNVPATIFITTKYVDQHSERLWWDEIEYFFKNHSGAKLKYRKNISNKLIDTVNKLINTKTNKCSKVRTFIHDLYNISESERKALIKTLKRGKTNNLMLTWNQINSMATHIQIGSHTVNHPFLDTLSPDEISKEFNQSKSVIEEKTGKKCISICYPVGFVTEKVVKQAIKSGYECGVTTKSLNNSPKTNIHLLNRKDSGFFYLNNKMKKHYFLFAISSLYDLFGLYRIFKKTVKGFFKKK